MVINTEDYFNRSPFSRHNRSANVNVFDAWNIARSILAQGLQQIEITDLYHPPAKGSPFVDVKLDAGIKGLARASRVHWRITVLSPFYLQPTDELLSPGCWQEKQIARLAKSMGEPYRMPENLDSPRRQERDVWTRGLYQKAESYRSRAILCVEGEHSKRGQTRLPMLYSLGYQSFLTDLDTSKQSLDK